MLPDVSGITNTAVTVAQKTGNLEIYVIVVLLCAVISVVWYYINRK